MAKKKPISIPNKDIYQRMNFLYQAQTQYKHLLPSYFNRQMKQVARKVVLRIDPSIKRTICKKCNALVDFVGYEKKAVFECKVCGTLKKFGNKQLFNDLHSEIKTLIMLRRVASATPLISKFKIPPIPLPPQEYFTTENCKSKKYPLLQEKKKQVDHLQEKLVIDLTRQFNGLSENQRKVLTTIIDKGGALRKKAKLNPGIYETIKDELYDDYLKEEKEAELQEEPRQSIQHGMIGELGIMMDGSNDLQESFASEVEDELQYPIEEYQLTPKPQIDDDRYTTPRRKKRTEQKKATLKQIYSQFIDNNKNPNAVLTTEDLEQEAVAAMQRVSLDLQTWVVDVLDHSINLDEKVIQQVQELDEKYRDVELTKKKDTQIIESDIAGFNVLLNACKPAILETKPLMRLNVVQETFGTGDTIDSAYEKQKKSKELWNETMAKTESLKPISTSHRFGGIVQQKLDEINQKREMDLRELEIDLPRRDSITKKKHK
ncbi:Ribonuclease P protein subunit p21 [Terramyces sp. JEL0728]|nr:Ribonuclease P protein subunit p21 [Terramyces sp. JEL0728]